MIRTLAPALLALCLASPALADEAAPASPDMVKDYAGAWLVQDGDGKKSCAVTLGTDDTIGGSVIDVAANCAKLFPVMDEIAAWRLYEDGQIVFADATRKERLRFYTPDDSYVTVKEVDGIVRLVPASQ